MKRNRTQQTLLAVLTAFGCTTTFHTRAAEAPIALAVDARDISRRILHAKLQIPASPGPLTLLYPKWIPGEHSPTGPITDLVGLKMSAGGQPIAWRRDPVETCIFHLEVPAGASNVEVTLDYLLASDPSGFSSGASSSATLGAVSWNTVLLYPQGAAANAITYSARLQLPEGWKYATALPRAGESPEGIQFQPVTLERLIDSPLIAGAHLRTFDLSPGSQAPQRLNVVAESAAALEMTPEDQGRFSNLVQEANALFGAHHYRSYDFLLTLSEQVAHFGLEHHESSDDRGPERMLIDEAIRKNWAFLLPHEMVHSWNGKYRRPAGLATPDYQAPMRTELLWVYEGLTDYLGEILAARSGLWNVTNYTEQLAMHTDMLEHQRGRDWRPLVDTTDAAQLLYAARDEGTSWRRSTDFYPEGTLIWLEADVTIRRQTQGQRSLDDFCRQFFGGENTGPQVVTYTLADVIKALNEVAPFDWSGFFQSRIYSVRSHAPLGGIQEGGWRLVYRDTPSDMLKGFEADLKLIVLADSIGLVLKQEGRILDVIPGSPADRAGIGAGMKLLGVNGRRWTPELLRTAIKETKTSPIELLVENGDVFKTCRLEYHDGERYPYLERDSAKPDVLADIIQPRAPERSRTAGQR
jgi:predicted metalloprotease with PDZ domain